MNVALFHQQLIAKGGAENLLLELLRKSSHRITLFTYHIDKENASEEFLKYDVREVGHQAAHNGVATKRLWLSYKDLTTKIELKNFDAFVVSVSVTGDLITIRNHELPVICYCHRPFNDWLTFSRYTDAEYKGTIKGGIFRIAMNSYALLAKLAWRHFSFVLANSEHNRQRILEAKLARDVSVLNYGVDTDKFKPSGNFENYFLVPGRINPFKRQHLAIEAFKLFSKHDKDFKLVIAGFVNKDDYAYLQKLKLAAEGNENIIFKTSVSEEELIRLYQNTYTVLFTGNDNWAAVPQEAMACGKPVIATSDSGQSQFVINERTGFLVEPSAQRFAEKMQLLSNDFALTSSMGIEGRKRAMQTSRDEFIRKFDSYIEETVKCHYR